jgi:putative DNA primase/helicase
MIKTRAAKLTEAARQYHDNHHWVPLRLTGKDPSVMGDNWQKRTLKNAIPEFKVGDNIGVLLGKASGNLVRRDPDYESIPEVTSLLFPGATLTFGRASSPQSGRLYTCDIKSKDFDLPNSMKADPRLPLHDGKPSLKVFQILSTDRQTVVPPSIHPETKEEIIWQSPPDIRPLSIEAPELLWRTGLEAFLMAVRQFWPAHGTRNQAALALGRVLLEALAEHYPDDDERCALVDALVIAVAVDGGDGEESRKGKDKRAAKTLKKMRDADEKTTGMTRLLELLELPKDVAATFRKWLGLGLDEGSISGLPTIYCAAGQIPRLTNEAEQSLIKAGAEIYAHGGHLVQPVIEECDASHGRKTMVARFRPMTDVTMVEAMSNTATWKKLNAKEEWIRTDPPVKIANTLLEREGRWHLRRVVGVITCPTLRPDGSLLSEPGYDPATKLLLVSPPPMPAISEKPTREEAEAALALIDGLLDEFPFVDDVSRSVGLSMLLTTVCRGAMICAPAHMVSAPEAGTGKSYLIDTSSTITTGRYCPVIAAAKEDAETEKRLVAILLKGQPLVSIDNVNGLLQGDLLCQMITQPIVDVRVLGLSKIVTVDNRVTLFLNGNNIRVVDDMVRRVVRCRLDAQMERPEIRRFAGSPIDTVLADRGRYVAAALTVVRAYIAAGRPGAKDLSPFLGFDGWNSSVRGALVWLGKEDPCKSIEGARQEDPGRVTLARVVGAIAELNFTDAVTVGQLVKLAKETKDKEGSVHEKENVRPELHDALAEAVDDHGRIGSRALGRWLSDHKDKVVGGFKIIKKFDSHLGQAKWQVEKWPK